MLDTKRKQIKYINDIEEEFSFHKTTKEVFESMGELDLYNYIEWLNINKHRSIDNTTGIVGWGDKKPRNTMKSDEADKLRKGRLQSEQS